MKMCRGLGQVGGRERVVRWRGDRGGGAGVAACEVCGGCIRGDTEWVCGRAVLRIEVRGCVWSLLRVVWGGAGEGGVKG